MGLLLGSITLGVWVGWKRLLPTKILDNSSRVMTISIGFLLIIMGMNIGLDRETIYRLGEYGLLAFFFALTTIAFSILAVGLLEKGFIKDFAAMKVKSFELSAEGKHHPYRMTFLIVGGFFLGVLLGFFLMPQWVKAYLPDLTTGVLYFSIFAVGTDLGQNKDLWKQFLVMGPVAFIAPIGVAFGSIVAGMLVGALTGWSIWEGAAVGAGFGWYSLSAVLISEIHSVSLGTIAFLSNVIREVLAILIIPFLANRKAKLILVAPGGATTMDTTLPVIATVGPQGIVIIALINGVVLSSLVPILVPLLLSR